MESHQIYNCFFTTACFSTKKSIYVLKIFIGVGMTFFFCRKHLKFKYFVNKLNFFEYDTIRSWMRMNFRNLIFIFLRVHLQVMYVNQNLAFRVPYNDTRKINNFISWRTSSTNNPKGLIWKIRWDKVIRWHKARWQVTKCKSRIKNFGLNLLLKFFKFTLMKLDTNWIAKTKRQKKISLHKNPKNYALVM